MACGSSSFGVVVVGVGVDFIWLVGAAVFSVGVAYPVNRAEIGSEAQTQKTLCWRQLGFNIL